jgi:hypothetical protein
MCFCGGEEAAIAGQSIVKAQKSILEDRDAEPLLGYLQGRLV